jgi:hypothetical protein
MYPVLLYENREPGSKSSAPPAYRRNSSSGAIAAFIRRSTKSSG